MFQPLLDAFYQRHDQIELEVRRLCLLSRLEQNDIRNLCNIIDNNFLPFIAQLIIDVESTNINYFLLNLTSNLTGLLTPIKNQAINENENFLFGCDAALEELYIYLFRQNIISRRLEISSQP